MADMKTVTTQAEAEQRYPVIPLGFSIDIQPGPDGEPWCRVQIMSIGISSTFCFPPEFSESVIDKLTDGIRQAAQKATSTGAGFTPPPAPVDPALQVPPEFMNRAARRRAAREESVKRHPANG